MSRAILVVLSPKECRDLLNGDLSILVRKVKPKCDLPIDVYIYCTKAKKTNKWAKRNILCSDVHDGKPTGHYQLWLFDDGLHTILNGKVVAKFTLNKVEEIKLPYTFFGTNDYVGCEEERTLQTETLDEKDLLKASCLDEEEIYKYLNFKHSPDKCGYAWHIDNLVTFDKPMELEEFKVDCWEKSKSWRMCQACKWNISKNQDTVKCDRRLTKAPQSWGYIEVRKGF